MSQWWLWKNRSRQSCSISSSNNNNNNNCSSYNNKRAPLLLLVLLLLCLMAIAVHATTTPALESSNETCSTGGGTSTSTSSSSSESFWDADIFHLPPHVPFPGADWLQRIATPETVIVDTVTGRSYSSIYAMLVNHNNNNSNQNIITISSSSNNNTSGGGDGDGDDGNPLDHPCRNLNAYINSIFFSPFMVEFLYKNIMQGSIEGTHYVLTYIRNFIGAMIVYYGVAGIFHYFCYIHQQSYSIFEGQKRPRPSSAIIWDQIQVAQSSMAVYVLYTIMDEYLVEQGYTQVYYTMSQVGGWPYYVLTMVTYFACVEIGIYWMHRTLHTNKFLYKYVHLKHHKYNKPETLTPWASIAFHPLDGILQACPYTLLLPIVPCHYLSHFLLLFFTAIWATYIHDAMDFNIYPIMGSKYHTVHHTHYLFNFGQVFVFCDYLFGTLREPTGPTGVVLIRSNFIASKRYEIVRERERASVKGG